jgi:hypothetical protein
VAANDALGAGGQLDQQHIAALEGDGAPSLVA